MDPLTLTPAHSPDGQWWWDGARWLPACSPSGQWWFDGSRWMRTGPAAWQRVRLPALGWLALLSLPCGLLFRMGVAGNWSTFPDGYLPWLVTTAMAAVVCAIALGAWVGRLRAWSAVPLLALSGGAVLGCWYIAMMFASTPPDVDGSMTDTATGAGLVIFGVPALAGLLVLLYAGTLIGWVTRRARDRTSPCAAGC